MSYFASDSVAAYIQFIIIIIIIIIIITDLLCSALQSEKLAALQGGRNRIPNVMVTGFMLHSYINFNSSGNLLHDIQHFNNSQDAKDINTTRKDHLQIFTDGSVFNGPVGSGACSAILFPTSLEHDFYSFSKAVGKKVSSVVCEVEGILLGIERAIQFFQGSQTHRNTEYVYIFSDCTTAIDTVVNMNQCHHFPDLLHRLYALMNQLHYISIKFVSIPAHSGIFGNEVADKEAKCVAHKISVGIISAPDTISIKDTYRIAANIAHKSWQRKWNKITLVVTLIT